MRRTASPRCESRLLQAVLRFETLQLLYFFRGSLLKPRLAAQLPHTGQGDPKRLRVGPGEIRVAAGKVSVFAGLGGGAVEFLEGEEAAAVGVVDRHLLPREIEPHPQPRTDELLPRAVQAQGLPAAQVDEQFVLV